MIDSSADLVALRELRAVDPSGRVEVDSVGDGAGVNIKLKRSLDQVVEELAEGTRESTANEGKVRERTSARGRREAERAYWSPSSAARSSSAFRFFCFSSSVKGLR